MNWNLRPGICRSIGLYESSAYRSHGFDSDHSLLNEIAKNDHSPDRWNKLSTADRCAVVFWYRMDKHPVTGASLHSTYADRRDPPISEAGSGLVELSPTGQLVHLAVAATEEDASTDDETNDIDAARPPPIGSRSRVCRSRPGPEPVYSLPSPQAPSVYCDKLRCFVGKDTAADAKQRVIQIGSYLGRINWFDIVTPWIVEEDRTQPPAAAFIFAIGISATVILISIRNLKLGRGDRRGAFRLAVFIVVSMMLGWAIRGVVASGTPFNLFQKSYL